MKAEAVKSFDGESVVIRLEPGEDYFQLCYHVYPDGWITANRWIDTDGHTPVYCFIRVKPEMADRWNKEAAHEKERSNPTSKG